MAFKTTMAIIGAASHTGAAIAKSMAASYHLLLMDSTEQKLIELHKAIMEDKDDAAIDTLLCCKEASWEADAIVVAVDGVQLTSVAQKIKEVTTCKPVIHFTTDGCEAGVLQQMLPHANVVNVWLSRSVHATGSINDAIVQGTNVEALEVARTILLKLGCETKTSERV